MEYDLASTHRWMIRDSARTDAFRQAIAAVVKPGDVVLDVGAGSGILSMFAAKAGARMVYAVEQTEIAALAAQLVQKNGLSDRVQILQTDVQTLVLPEQADVIISEWLGTIGVDENLLGMVLVARDRWLKPGGTMVPARVTAKMAPAHIPMRPEVAFFHQRPYGLDLTPLSESSIHELLCLRRKVRREDLAAAASELWVTDMATVPSEQAYLPFRANVRFTIPCDTPVNTLAAWFEADMATGLTLSNAPEAPETHWGQLLLPLRQEIALQENDVLEVWMTCIPAGPCSTSLAWSVRRNDEAWEHHDTRIVAGGHASHDELQFMNINGVDSMEQLPHSDLTKFLARLAIDPDYLRDFIIDPNQVLTGAKLPKAEYSALISRNAAQIQSALYKYETPPEPPGAAETQGEKE